MIGYIAALVALVGLFLGIQSIHPEDCADEIQTPSISFGGLLLFQKKT